MYEEADENLHRTSLFHLHLHGPTSLESRSAPDDQSQVVCPEL